MENKYQLSPKLMELEIERDDKNRLTDDFLKKTINKISAVSSLIAVESRRGPAQKLIFVGNKAAFILKEIESNTNYYSTIKRQFEIETKKDDNENYIELSREGDNMYLEEGVDRMGIKTYDLKYSKEKQPDYKRVIQIIENKKE